MPFTSMIKMTKITVSDKNGKNYEIEGQIQNNMVYIYKNVPIDTGYRFSYKLSNGVEKTVVVIEPGYYGDVTMGGGFPIYQCKVQDLEEYEKSRNNTASNISITNQNGTVIIGNVNNSPISISNSFTELERKIESDGGTDKEELLDLLEQVKELCETMEASKSLPKSKSLMKKNSTHMTTHAWFYTEVAKIVGATVMKVIENF